MNQDDTVEIAGLLHHKWTECYQLLQDVVAEKDDGTIDWHAFHEERLTVARYNETKWLGIRDRFTQEQRTVLKEAFGL